MKLPRITVCRLMVTVVVAAVLLGGFVLLRRSREFRDRAHWHGVLARSPLIKVDPLISDMDGFRVRWSEYQDRLRLKYERAARYPWLQVEPDPPAPK
jgi:hypothetical protein